MNRRATSQTTLAGLALAALVLTGCSIPGGNSAVQQGIEVTTEIGPEPVTIRVRVNADQEDMWKALAEGFMSDYPSVTVALESEAFGTLQENAPRYLSGSNVPDLFRLAVPGDTVKDGLLLDLDPYAEAWGWNDFPESQLEQWRVSGDGSLGQGSLYAMGAGFGLVGIYFNADKLSALGFSEAPTTVSQLEAVLAAAVAAGETPLQGDAAYLFQMLVHAYGGAAEVRAWVNRSPGASINVPAAIEAATTLQAWSAKGYLPQDLTTTDPGAALGSFLNGGSVLFAQGSWFAGAIDAADGRFGFTLPPQEAVDAGAATMSASNSMVIPARAAQPNEAAAFLDWIQRDEGRRIVIEVGGLAPGGIGELSPTTWSGRTVFGETILAFQAVSDDDGIVGFLGNVSAGFSGRALNPQLDILLAQRTSPEDFVAFLQADFETSNGE